MAAALGATIVLMVLPPVGADPPPLGVELPVYGVGFATQPEGWTGVPYGFIGAVDGPEGGLPREPVEVVVDGVVVQTTTTDEWGGMSFRIAFAADSEYEVRARIKTDTLFQRTSRAHSVNTARTGDTHVGWSEFQRTSRAHSVNTTTPDTAITFGGPAATATRAGDRVLVVLEVEWLVRKDGEPWAGKQVDGTGGARTSAPCWPDAGCPDQATDMTLSATGVTQAAGLWASCQLGFGPFEYAAGEGADVCNAMMVSYSLRIEGFPVSGGGAADATLCA